MRCPLPWGTSSRNYHHHLSVGKFPNLKVSWVVHVYLACRVSEYLAEFVCIRLYLSCAPTPSSPTRTRVRQLARSRFLRREAATLLRKRAIRVFNPLKPVLFLPMSHNSTDRKYDEEGQRTGREYLCFFFRSRIEVNNPDSK